MKTARKIIENIDWKMLSRQKSTLNDLIDNHRYSQFKDEQAKVSDLEGLMSLIDVIQDYAVDTLGKDENEIFNLKTNNL